MSKVIKKESEKKIVYCDMDAYDIQKFQQNRYPLLFIDYVDEAVAGESAKGFKNFSYNEWFFPVHFEDEPNVPGFVQMEALTQMFLMSFLTLPGNEGKKTAFVKVESDFKKKIVPGNRLDIEANLDFYRRGLAKGKSVGYLNGEIACDAKLTIVIPDVLLQFKPTAEIVRGGYNRNRVIYFSKACNPGKYNSITSSKAA